MNEGNGVIFICSDSIGDTAEAVVKATISQFDSERPALRRWSHVKSEDEIRRIVEEASAAGAIVVYTLVLPELRETILEESDRLGVRAVDVMGPIMEAYVHAFRGEPKRQAGLLHRLDTEYYRKVEAIEFAVKCDDGQHTSLWAESDILLLGVSRTSKTPLSIFLAHKGIKVANLPVVPEVKAPASLFELDRSKIIGLTMNPRHLARIRLERLRSMGLPDGSSYASALRVEEELAFADGLFRQLGCRVLDVTERAIEETASTIIESRI